MLNIPDPALNNPAEPPDASPYHATPVIVVVVRRPGCGHEPNLEDVVIAKGRYRDGPGRHRQQARSWVDLAAEVLLRRSMTRRLVLLLLVVALPAAAVAAALALAGQRGLI